MQIRSRLTHIVLFLSLLSASILPSNAEDRIKIAVVPFTFANHTTTGVDVGREIAHLMVSKLNDAGNFSVVLTDSQTSSPYAQSVTPKQLVELGRKLDVDLVLAGNVQEFDLVMNTGPSGGQAAAMALRSAAAYAPYGGALIGVLGAMSSSAQNRGKVRALVDTKLIDVATGDTVLSLSGAGESKHTSASLWDRRDNYADFTTASFSSTCAGEATCSSIDPICDQLLAAAPRLASLVTGYKVLGSVSDVDDTLVCINLGKQDGLSTGGQLTIERALTPVAPGQKVRVGKDLTATVGTLQLKDVGKTTAIGTLSSAGFNGEPLIGDLVRKSTPESAASFQSADVHGAIIAQPTVSTLRADNFASSSPRTELNGLGVAGMSDASAANATVARLQQDTNRIIRYAAEGKDYLAEPICRRDLAVAEQLLGDSPGLVIFLVQKALIDKRLRKDADADAGINRACDILQSNRAALLRADAITALSKYIELLRNLHQTREADSLEGRLVSLR